MVTVIYPQTRKELRQSQCELDESADLAFSTVSKSPFRHFDPQLKQTGIFVDRFFFKLSFADLAVKYDIEEKQVADVYRKAVERLLTLVQYMDQRKSIENAAARVKARGFMPKSHQWFMMSRVLNMTPGQISDFEGIDPAKGLVRKQIARVADQLAAGESDIILFTPEQRQEAKSRLDKRRQSRRKKSDPA